MSILFTITTGDHAGHTLITWAIARRLMERSVRVGFLKPFGCGPSSVDRDTLLFRELLGIEVPPDRLCPFPDEHAAFSSMGADEITARISNLVRDLSDGNDILMIMGSRHIFFDDSRRPFSDISLIRRFRSSVVLVDRYRRESKSIYSALSVRSLVGPGLRAVVFNRVPGESLAKLREKTIPSLERKGIPVVAGVPEDIRLSSRSLREIRDILHADLIQGRASLAEPVGVMTVGAGDLAASLRPFKRVYNKIVLLKPPLSDVDEDDPAGRRTVAGILLTGGRIPPSRVLDGAKEAGVPVMRVNEDTFSALDRLKRTVPHLSIKDTSKAVYFTGLLDRDGLLDRIVDAVHTVPPHCD